jgi:hypothetical protein
MEPAALSNGIQRGTTSPHGRTRPSVSSASPSETTARQTTYSPSQMCRREISDTGRPAARASRHSADGSVSRGTAWAARTVPRVTPGKTFFMSMRPYRHRPHHRHLIF